MFEEKLHDARLPHAELLRRLPQGVEPATALMDLLSGWLHVVGQCAERSDRELRREACERGIKGKAEVEAWVTAWRAHYGEAHHDVIFTLYQLSAYCVLEDDSAKQAEFVERFVRENILPLFSRD